MRATTAWPNARKPFRFEGILVLVAGLFGEGLALPVGGAEPFEEGAEGGHAAGYKGEVVFYAARFWIKCVGG